MVDQKYNIILEGCDCTGKTILANELITHFKDYNIVHIGAPKGLDEFRETATGLVNKLNNEQGLIFDRALLGECVYGPIKRGYYPDYMRELEKTIKDHNILVLVTADEQIIQDRFDGKFLTREEIPIVLNKFDEEFNKANYQQKIKVDTTYNSSKQIAKHIYNEVINNGTFNRR